MLEASACCTAAGIKNCQVLPQVATKALPFLLVVFCIIDLVGRPKRIFPVPVVCQR